MNNWKCVGRFARVSIKENFHSIVFYLVLIVIFLIIQYLCAGIGSYLRSTEDQMNLFEIYIWFNSRRQSHVIYLLGLLFLICGTTFFHTGASYYLLRATRKIWVLSQIVYLFATVLIYNFVILLSFWISCKGALTLRGEWSMAAFTACQFWTEDIGIVSFIMADYGFLRHNPNTLGVITLCLQVLVGVIVGMIMVAFQAKGKMVVGVMVVVLLWFVEVMFDEHLHIAGSEYLTPFRLATPAQLALNGSGPSVTYAFVYMIVLAAILTFVLTKLSKQVDFIKME